MCSIECGLLLPLYRGLSVCLLVTRVCPAKTAKPIEFSFELRTHGLTENVLGWGPGYPTRRGTFGVGW